MDRTLLSLLLLSVVLVILFAPHATATLISVLLLSAITTRVAWAALQYLGQSKQPQQALD